MTRLRASRFGEAGSAYEPEDPDVDEPLDEVELLLVEDDVDVLSLVDEVPEEAVGLVSPEDLLSPEALPSPEDFLA